MSRTQWVGLISLVAATSVSVQSVALAQEDPAARASAGFQGPHAGFLELLPTSRPDAAILDTSSSWRCFIARGSELVRLESGQLQPLNEMAPAVQVKAQGKYVVQMNKTDKVALTTVPPADWMDPDFDDSSWLRTRGPFDWSYNPKVLLCLRGRFEVADPARIGPVTISLAFHGGVVVYLNGKELKRAYLSASRAGRVEPTTPADDYPNAAYVTADGEPPVWGRDGARKFAQQFTLRRREVSVRIPPEMLRKGVNALAIEVHRAPAAGVQFRGKAATPIPGYLQYGGHSCSLWPRLAVGDIRLTARGAAGAQAEGQARARLRVQPADVLTRVYPWDLVDPSEPGWPVRICGARNGAFSGQLVVSADKPLGLLSVQVSDLTDDKGGTIPASNFQVRYAALTEPAGRRDGPAAFDALEDTPPAGNGSLQVQPVWLTVQVPGGAKPGRYSGRVSVKTEGMEAVETAVELDVTDFVLPAPADFATHVGLIQSPESGAIQYKLDMWSEAHWRRIEKAFELLAQVGNKEVYIPVIRRTHFGNEHGMVRWVRQADGSVKPDFSVAERYLDLAVKHLGAKPVVVVYCWEPAAARGSFPAGASADSRRKDMPIYYTVVDPATGKLSDAEGPAWGTPACRAFWKSLFDGMRQLLAERELSENQMLAGVSGDYSPTDTALSDIAAAFPGIRWMVHSHTWWQTLHGQPVGYLASVWGISGPRDPGRPVESYGSQRYYGWRAPTSGPVVLAFPRVGCEVHERVGFNSPPALYREVAEGALVSAGRSERKSSGGVQGFSRIGADFWSVLPSRNGLNSILGRYPETAWGSLHMGNGLGAILGAGSDGPVSTIRLEMLREGLQEAEARVFLEKVLTDPARKAKLSDDLAQRCQRLLDDRVRDYLRCKRRQDDDWLWFAASGWMDRTRSLFAMAAEVQAIVGAVP